MPFKTYGCSICGKQAPKELRHHRKFRQRMAWLRKHYKLNHPKEFKEWYRKKQ